MLRTLLLALAALGGGVALAIQAPVNARLRVVLADSPFASALISVIVTTVVLAAAVALLGEGDAVTGHVGGGPWWAYIGGLCGAVFLVATLIVVGQEGVTFTFVAVVAGQIVAAMIVDRLGLLGVAPIALHWQRVVAAILVVAALGLLLQESGSR